MLPPATGRGLRLFLAALVGLLAAIVALVTLAPPANAQTVVDIPTGTTITLTPVVVSVLAGLVLPVVTGLITRVGTSDGVKAAVSFVLIAAAAVITTVTTAPTFDVRAVVLLFVTTLVTHAASWLQIWQPMKPGGPDGAPGAGLLGIIGPRSG